MLDFWDLGKVLVRRWLISLPLLLLTIGSTYLIFVHVKPDYVATAYLQLVPPVPVAVPAGDPTPPQRNPWLFQDLKVLGSAALVSVQDASFAESLTAAGYTDSFTAVMADETPLITFQVTGQSAPQAGGTADRIIARFNQSVLSLQTSYGVAPVDRIIARRLDSGTNVVKSSSNAKRAIAAVAVAGLLLTVALTIGSDAWLRRRKARKQAGTAPVATTPDAGGAPRAEPTARPAGAKSAQRRPPDPAWDPEGTETASLMMTRIFTTSGSSTTYRPASDGEVSDGPSPGAAVADFHADSDATIVLPKTIST